MSDLAWLAVEAVGLVLLVLGGLFALTAAGSSR